VTTLTALCYDLGIREAETGVLMLKQKLIELLKQVVSETQQSGKLGNGE